MNTSPKDIKVFQKKILTWYAANKRDLPWRKSRDPYRILISEVMLQQTQVARVIVKFEVWMQHFPTVTHLAKAKVSDVLQHWSGLGYNRRALNLKKTAAIIAKDFDGKFPQNEKELLQLPGIGEYTARALLCFAFDQQVTVIYTNVRKVVITQFGITDDKAIKEFVARLLPAKKAYEWNQALMDYAAAVLKKEKIPLPKQSTFIGSHRYYRGQILKKLLEQKKIAVLDLGLLIKKDYTTAEETWLNDLLDELTREGFIIVERVALGRQVRLAA